MVGTIDQSCQNTDHRIPGKHTGFTGFAETFFDCREEVSRNGTAEDGFFKDHFFAVGGLKLDPNVTVLTVTAGLFLMFTLDFDFLMNGLAVWYTRFFKTELDTEFALEFADNNVKVLLTKSGEDLLFGFSIDFIGNGGILFDQTSNGGSDFAVIGFAFGEHSHAHAGCREFRFAEGDDTFRIAKGIAGLGFRQFGDSADIAGRKGINSFLGFAVHNNHFTETFLTAGTGIDGSCASSKSTGNDFYEGKFTNKGVGNGFEYKSGKRCIGIAFDFDLFAVGIHNAFTGDFFGRWAHFFERAHKERNAAKSKCIAAIDRSDGMFGKTFFKAADAFFLGESFAAEIFLHQIFIGFGDGFGKSIFQIIDAGIVRDVGFDGFAFSVELIGFFGKHIDINFADRNDDRADGATEFFFQLIKSFIEIGVFLIHFGNEESTGFMAFFCQFPCFFGTDQNTGFCGKSNNDRVSGTDTFIKSTGKVEKSGSIHDVDFDTFIFKRCGSGRYGDLTANFFRVVVANGISVSNGAETIRRTGDIEHRLCQRSFAVRSMTGQSNVSDIVCSVLFQNNSPLSQNVSYRVIITEPCPILQYKAQKNL